MQHSLTGAELAGGRVASIAARRGRERAWLRAMLIGVDAIGVASAFALAYLLRFKTSVGAFYLPPDSPLRFYSTLVFLLVPGILLWLIG